MHDELSEATHNPANTRYGNYFSLPKAFGHIKINDLVTVAEGIDFENPVISDWLRARDYLIYGSCEVELAVATPDPENVLLDQRLALIDEAVAHFRAAADIEMGLLQEGRRAPDDTDDWLRAELQACFENVYKDLICGEVTTQTRAEIISALLVHRQALIKLRNRSSRAYYRRRTNGLLGEVEAMLAIWQRDDNTVAFPSTVRGGDGSYAPTARDTHDIVIADLNEARLKFHPLEIKRRKKVDDEALVRYSAPIGQVGYNGQLRIIA